MNTETIISESVFDAYNNDILDINHTCELYESLYTEGTNTTIMKKYKEYKNEFKKYANEMKKIAKNGNPDDREKFNKAKKNAIKSLDEASDMINDTESDIASGVLGFLAVCLIDTLKWWIPAVLTFGIAGFVPRIHELINLIQGIINASKGTDNVADAFNLFKQRHRDYISMNRSILDTIEVRYEKKINKNKK